ncbi:MAG: response regulator [Syntrophobacteraceae bacterium]
MSKPLKILMIDDEELFVKNMIHVLTRRGMSAKSANNGASAIELLSEAGPGSFDVIVLDLRMPGMDGLETLKAIRQLDALTPVIMLTGHADLKQVSQALKDGIDEVLLKPCPIDALVATIENVHERRVCADQVC